MQKGKTLPFYLSIHFLKKNIFTDFKNKKNY